MLLVFQGSEDHRESVLGFGSKGNVWVMSVALVEAPSEPARQQRQQKHSTVVNRAPQKQCNAVQYTVPE